CHTAGTLVWLASPCPLQAPRATPPVRQSSGPERKTGRPDAPLLPPSAADPSTSRRKAFIVAHDELGFDLIDRIHGDTHHDQKRRTPEIKGNVETIQDPCRKLIEEIPA